MHLETSRLAMLYVTCVALYLASVHLPTVYDLQV
jgi:hypothetical protein